MSDTLSDVVKAQIADVIDHYKALAKDGWTISEVWTMANSAIASFMRVVEAAGGYSGADKKAAVLDAAAKFYDAVIAPLDIPKIPDFLETSFVDPALKSLFLKLVSGAIDSMAAIFNRVGWQDAPVAPPTTPEFQPY